MDNPFEILIQQNAEILLYLRELKGSPITSPVITPELPEDTNLTYDELANYLKKDKSTIHRYKKNGVFPYYQAGRTVFFKRSEVDAAMSSMSLNKKGAKAHG
jgi:excisionase family DNA binding protein